MKNNTNTNIHTNIPELLEAYSGLKVKIEYDDFECEKMTPIEKSSKYSIRKLKYYCFIGSFRVEFYTLLYFDADCGYYKDLYSLDIDVLKDLAKKWYPRITKIYKFAEVGRYWEVFKKDKKAYNQTYE